MKGGNSGLEERGYCGYAFRDETGAENWTWPFRVPRDPRDGATIFSDLIGKLDAMELKALVKLIANTLKKFDSSGPVFKTFGPAAGPKPNDA